jgi:hypothetical protein
MFDVPSPILDFTGWSRGKAQHDGHLPAGWAEGSRRNPIGPARDRGYPTNGTGAARTGNETDPWAWMGWDSSDRLASISGEGDTPDPWMQRQGRCSPHSPGLRPTRACDPTHAPRDIASYIGDPGSGVGTPLARKKPPAWPSCGWSVCRFDRSGCSQFSLPDRYSVRCRPATPHRPL